jgi:uncharacterized protein (TIGR03437 family)
VITQSPGIDGIPSPLLYVGPHQINFRAPFEIAGAAQANIAFASTQLNRSDSLTAPAPVTGAGPVSRSASGVAVRDANLSVWVK